MAGTLTAGLAVLTWAGWSQSGRLSRVSLTGPPPSQASRSRRSRRSRSWTPWSWASQSGTGHDPRHSVCASCQSTGSARCWRRSTRGTRRGRRSSMAVAGVWSGPLSAPSVAGIAAVLGRRWGLIGAARGVGGGQRPAVVRVVRAPLTSRPSTRSPQSTRGPRSCRGLRGRGGRGLDFVVVGFAVRATGHAPATRCAHPGSRPARGRCWRCSTRGTKRGPCGPGGLFGLPGLAGACVRGLAVGASGHRSPDVASSVASLTGTVEVGGPAGGVAG